MASRTRRGVMVLAGAACTGGVVWLAAGVHTRAAATAPVAPSVDSAAGAAPALASRLGEQRRYPARIVTDLTLSPEVLVPAGARVVRQASATRSIHQEVRGKVVETSLDPWATISRVSVDDAEVALVGERQPRIERALAQGILVRRDPRGRVERVRLPKDADASSDAALRMLPMLLEWTRDEQAPAGATSSWDAEEATVDGDAAVHYELAEHAGEAPAFTRRIDRLTRIGRAAPGPALVPSESGTLRGEVDLAAGRVAMMRGDLGWVRRTAAAEVFAEGRTEVAFERAAVTIDPDAAARASAHVEEVFGDWVALGDASAPRDAQALLRADILGSQTLAEALRDLDATDAAASAHAQRYLRAYLDEHPELAARLAREIADLPRGSRGSLARLGALASHGGPESQRALVGLVQQWKGTDRGSEVLVLLAQAHAPTLETESFVRGLQTDPAAAGMVPLAQSTLAAMAGQLQDSDPARADAVAADFEARVRAASNPVDLTQALVCLGDTRSERIADVVPQFLSSDDPSVRRAAVFALGRAPDEAGTSPTLEQIAQSDPDDRVRAAALRALRGRGG